MTVARSELDAYFELIRDVYFTFLQAQLRGEDLAGYADQALVELYAKIMSSTEVNAAKTMECLSEIAHVRRECGLSVPAFIWREVRVWLASHWVDEPEFVQNSLWMIAHGEMHDLYFRIEAAIRDKDLQTRADAVAAWAMLKDKGLVRGG